MRKFTPKQYLMIDVASNFGLEKETWDTRLEWFATNEKSLMDLVEQAENPALYYAGVQAYYDALAGIPSGYPISLDGTSSGLQILAALTGDRRAASICNVVNRITQDGINAGVPERADAYTIVYHLMVDELGEAAKITRTNTKRAIMTSLYGSKEVPKEVFGEGILLNVFYSTMKAVAPAAWELNEMFLAMWDPEALTYEWVLPDNFHVKTKVMNQVKDTVHFLNEPFDVYHKVNAPTEEGRSLGANTTHSIDGMIVREMVRRCDYDPARIAEIRRMINGDKLDNPKYQDKAYMRKMGKGASTLWNHYLKSNYLSAAILDYITPATLSFINKHALLELLDSLPVKPFKLMTVHDCFRCLPNYGNDLREQYTRQLYLIARSNLLSFILSQILGKEVTINKLDKTLFLDVLKAEYALS